MAAFYSSAVAEPSRCMLHAACCMLHVARCRLMLHAMWCGGTSRALAFACRAAPLAATPSPVERTDGMAGAQVRAPLFRLQPSALHRRARLSCCCVGVHPTDMPCSTVARCDVAYATRQQLLSVRGSAVGCDGRLLDCSSRGAHAIDIRTDRYRVRYLTVRTVHCLGLDGSAAPCGL